MTTELRRLTLLTALGATSILLSFLWFGSTAPVHPKLQKLNQDQMAQIKGQEGLAFSINWRVSAPNASLEIYESESWSGHLTLTGLDMDDGFGNRVSFGTISDPFRVNVEGNNNGYLVMRFPSTETTMDIHDVHIDEIDFYDDDTFESVALTDLQINNARYAGGTRLAIGGYDGGQAGQGGLRVGIAIQLDGDLLMTADSGENASSGLTFDGLHGAGDCTADGGGNCPPDQWWEWNFSGALDWANLAAGRPIAINWYVEGGTPKIHGELNPNANPASFGTLGIEDAQWGSQSFGEVFIRNISLGNLEMFGPITAPCGSNGCAPSTDP